MTPVTEIFLSKYILRKMSKAYTEQTAALKTVTHDTTVLDSQKILVYPGEGARSERKDILAIINEKDDLIKDEVSALDTRLDDAEADIDELVADVATLESKNYAYTDTANTFNGANTFNYRADFNYGLQVLSIGANKYGLSVTPPSEDGTSGGLQLWGVQFAQKDEWSDNALKIFHNELALFGNHQNPCSLTFDNANVVNFRVMPDDGSAANNGQGAIFDFQGWQWDDDTQTSKNANCPVQILKNNAGELVDRSLLNKAESDARYAQLHSENSLTETNTFEKTIIAEDGLNATSGDIVVGEGVITFEDLIDGTVVERSGASGYQYVQGIPTSFNNGVCYDIGEISSTTDLSNVRFSSENLVQTCELWFRTPATVPTGYKWPTDLYWIDSATGAAPTLIASKNYRLVFRREPNKIIASIAYLY